MWRATAMDRLTMRPITPLQQAGDRSSKQDMDMHSVGALGVALASYGPSLVSQLVTHKGYLSLNCNRDVEGTSTCLASGSSGTEARHSPMGPSMFHSPLVVLTEV